MGMHPLASFRRCFMAFLIRLLTKERKGYTTRIPNNLSYLKRHLRKGDVILVEGNQRISEVIKYLTQSSWSHATIYVGDELIRRRHPLAPVLIEKFGNEANYLIIEALLEEGVVACPLAKYACFNLRICRPRGLHKEDLQVVLDEVIGELGHQYDLKNLLDLARYFFPVSLVPRRLRRTALQAGSGLPTQVICSSLIAKALNKVGFPILPQVTISDEPQEPRYFLSLYQWFFGSNSHRGVFRRRSPSLVTPRDFDLSPYFEIIKLHAIEGARFDYRKINWLEEEELDAR